MREERECPSCGLPHTDSLGAFAKTMDVEFSWQEFSLVQCARCDLIYLGQELSQKDFARMYEESLQFNGSVYREPETVAAAKAFYKTCYERLLREIGIDAPEARVLEVGAGRAWMCMVAHEAHSGLTVAQDVSPECATECPWVDHYVVGNISDPAISAHAPYDVISLTHVIEHVPHPVEFMRELKGLLSARGRMFVTAPHRPPDWSREPTSRRWQEWSYHHVPGHLQYFSEQAMSIAAAAADLRLVHWALHEDGQAFEAVLEARPL